MARTKIRLATVCEGLLDSEATLGIRFEFVPTRKVPWSAGSPLTYTSYEHYRVIDVATGQDFGGLKSDTAKGKVVSFVRLKFEQHYPMLSIVDKDVGDAIALVFDQLRESKLPEWLLVPGESK